MKLKIRERGFLLFFLPLFATKLLNYTAGDMVLIVVAGFAFLMFCLYNFKTTYSKNQFNAIVLLMLFSSILLFTSGKQGILFSVIMIVAMKGVDLNRKIYDVLVYFGIVIFLIACFIARDSAGEASRFLNGEWTSMNKRNNILYVSFMAVTALYVMRVRGVLNIKQLAGLGLCGYFAFLYIGSRTGLLSFTIMILCLIAFRFNAIKRSKIVKSLCLATPLFGMMFSYYAAANVKESEALGIMDAMMQFRLTQGNEFLRKYDVTMWGQNIEENFSGNVDYACLDCAYLDMLLALGLVFTFFWIVISTKVIDHLYKNNRMEGVAIMLAYAFYGMSETFLINCFLNVSLFYYGEYFYSLTAYKSRVTKIQMKMSNLHRGKIPPPPG